MATIFTEKVRHPSTNNWIPLFRVQENDNNKYELQFFDDTKNNFTSLNNMLTNRQNIIPDTSGLYSIGDSTHRYTNLYLTGVANIGNSLNCQYINATNGGEGYIETDIADISDLYVNSLTVTGTDATIKTKNLYLDNKQVKDYIIEEGSMDGVSANLPWDYRIWNSGKAECWITLGSVTPSWINWGSTAMYTSCFYIVPFYPIVNSHTFFNTDPNVTFGFTAGVDGWIGPKKNTASRSAPPDMYFYRFGQSQNSDNPTNISAKISYYAIGTINPDW